MSPLVLIVGSVAFVLVLGIAFVAILIPRFQEGTFSRGRHPCHE